MWPGRAQVVRTRARIDGGEDGRRAIRGGDARARRPLRVDRHVERVSNRVVFCWTIGGMSSSVEPFLRHRDADQPPAVRGHEVDDLRRDLLRRYGQIAFVLAILIVDDDDHLAVANRLDRVLDGGERRLMSFEHVWP